MKNRHKCLQVTIINLFLILINTNIDKYLHPKSINWLIYFNSLS